MIKRCVRCSQLKITNKIMSAELALTHKIIRGLLRMIFTTKLNPAPYDKKTIDNGGGGNTYKSISYKK